MIHGEGHQEGNDRAYQKVVLSTMILTVPGNLLALVKVESISMGSSKSPSMLISETNSSVSHSSRNQGGEPADLNMPAAAACVSVGELRVADGLFNPLEFLAISI